MKKTHTNFFKQTKKMHQFPNAHKREDFIVSLKKKKKTLKTIWEEYQQLSRVVLKTCHRL